MYQVENGMDCKRRAIMDEEHGDERDRDSSMRQSDPPIPGNLNTTIKARLLYEYV